MPSRKLAVLTALAAACLSGLASCIGAEVGGDPTLVATDLGQVRGATRAGVLEFKGIPYAEPPIGERRWLPPLPAKPWSGKRAATNYGNACPQVGRYGLTESSDQEDCLTLNVTVPASARPAAAKLPVIVWIHGGAFVGGSSALYPLDYMATTGKAIVVSLNYRLGVFGFMAHPAFGADYNGGYGLKDQRLALQWVKRNIASFGGDPGNITLAGESAGAASVCIHIIAPKETAGLFDKSIVQSAGCVTPLPSVADGNKIGEQVAALRYALCL